MWYLGFNMRPTAVVLLLLLLLTAVVTQQSEAAPDDHGSLFNYSDALSKSILFLEGQRSGKLPSDQRMAWRGDSALSDGNLANVDLTGGYYDAGDNVKYQLPMAFSVTMLSWGVLEYQSAFTRTGQLAYAHQAIRWGTDYFLKCAAAAPTRLWVQVGDPNSDHGCWERAEDMDTPRTAYQINASKPGTEVAAETAAALAAASIVFRDEDPAYAERLLNTAMTVFDFADSHRGTYGDACPYYCSSGYNDELLWAAAWLYKASNLPQFLRYVVNNSNSISSTSEFSWDNKNAGVQVLLSSLFFSGEASLGGYTAQADQFVCSTLPQSPQKALQYTPGGLLYVREGANMQYVAGSSFLLAVYGDAIATANRAVVCSGSSFSAMDLSTFAKSQVDYMLGKNPQRRSYMAGLGNNPPQQVHHRSASIVSIHNNPNHVGCGQGYTDWFDSSNPNPNVLTGAIVGGPNRNDGFSDLRNHSEYSEPTTYINAIFIGVLAKFS